jgi:hypothetical protein
MAGGSEEMNVTKYKRAKLSGYKMAIWRKKN